MISKLRYDSLFIFQPIHVEDLLMKLKNRNLFVFEIFQNDGTLTITVSGVLTFAVRRFLGYGDSKSKMRAIRLNMFMLMFLISTENHFVVLFPMQNSYSRTER